MSKKRFLYRAGEVEYMIMGDFVHDNMVLKNLVRCLASKLLEVTIQKQRCIIQRNCFAI